MHSAGFAIWPWFDFAMLERVRRFETAVEQPLTKRQALTSCLAVTAYRQGCKG